MLVRYIYFMVQRWISQGPCPPAQRSTVWRWPCVKPHRRERAPAFMGYILYIVLYIYWLVVSNMFYFPYNIWNNPSH